PFSPRTKSCFAPSFSRFEIFLNSTRSTRCAGSSRLSGLYLNRINSRTPLSNDSSAAGNFTVPVTLLFASWARRPGLRLAPTRTVHNASRFMMLPSLPVTAPSRTPGRRPPAPHQQHAANAQDQPKQHPQQPPAPRPPHFLGQPHAFGVLRQEGDPDLPPFLEAFQRPR